MDGQSREQDCNENVLEYWNHRDELSFEDGLIFKGCTLVNPGVTKTIRRAKNGMLWSGMSKQVTDLILDCLICLKHRDSNTKEPIILTEFPNRSYQIIGVDLFQFDDKDYLLTIDYYRRFFEVDFLPNSRSHTVIQKLRNVQTKDGGLYRRNRIRLHKTNKNVSDIQPPDLNIVKHFEGEKELPNISRDKFPVKLSDKNTTLLDNQSNQYTTRSGRAIKASTKYNTSEWTK
ncbi:hypothetical protein KUTeg_021748 [Tegillarca granosa]|uniref:Integrase zinc-binding domain-containing protein n=1 Tax=Tegillarca granosa TaxID=220873 RepID=A0ABQ9E486_TEGGR|nr:hypothetical protein KUTeg_021748 [Tegillarca granosa]